MAKMEITIDTLTSDYDWAAVFGEDDGGNTSKEVTTAVVGDGTSVASFSRTDVAEVIAAVNGEHDESDWVGVFRLKDGRFAVCYGSCDYTGWDCRGGNSMVVAKTLNDALLFGLSKEQCERLELVRPEESK